MLLEELSGYLIYGFHYKIKLSVII